PVPNTRPFFDPPTASSHADRSIGGALDKSSPYLASNFPTKNFPGIIEHLLMSPQNQPKTARQVRELSWE
ncbi:hypothetical protein Tsubulata_005914, partial [Turnera subulata]